MRWVRLGNWFGPVVAFGVAMTGVLVTGALLSSTPSSPGPTEKEPDWQVRKEAIRWSTQEKQRVAHSVITGEATLLDAAAEIRGIDQQSPHFRWDGFREHYAGETDDERHCREVIVWVQNVLGNEPAEADVWAGKLNAEIERHRQANTLRLPASGTPPR